MKIIDGSSIYNGLANYLATNAYLNDTAQDEAPEVSVKLPCKIGDRVWAIRSYKGHKHPQDGIVNEMYFTKDMRLHIVVKHIARGEWGKTIFATREEAVAAIEGRKNNENENHAG